MRSSSQVKNKIQLQEVRPDKQADYRLERRSGPRSSTAVAKTVFAKGNTCLWVGGLWSTDSDFK